MKAIINYLLIFSLVQTSLVLPTSFAQDDAEDHTLYARHDKNYSPDAIRPGKEQKANEKKGMMLKQLSLFATALAAPILISICPDKADSWMFTASAAIYLAMEVMAFSDYKMQSKAEMAYYKSKDHDEQIEALHTAAEITNKAAKSANKKSSFAKMAATGFLLAAAVATVDAARSLETGMGACGGAGAEAGAAGAGANSGASAGTNTGAAAGGGSVQTHSNGQWTFPGKGSVRTEGHLWHYNRGETYDRGPLIFKSASHSIKSIHHSVKNARTDAEAMANFQELELFRQGKLQSIGLDQYEKMKVQFGEKKTILKEVLVTAAIAISEFILPTARAEQKEKSRTKTSYAGMASTMAGLGIGAAISGALAPLIQVTSLSVLEPFRTNGFVRAAGYTAISGITYLAAREMDSAGSDLKKRANQYKKLAEQVEKKTLQKDRFATNYYNQSAKQELGRMAELNSDNADNTKINNGPCFIGQTGTIIADFECRCKRTGQCKKAEVPKVTFSTPNNLGALTAGSNLLGQGTSALYNGNTQRAQLAGASFGRYASKLKKLKKKMQNFVNKKRKEKKLNAIPFDRLEKSQENRLRKGGRNLLRGLSSAQRRSLAFLDRSTQEAGDANKKDGKKEQDKSPKELLASVMNSASKNANHDPFSKFNFEFQDEPKEEANDNDDLNAIISGLNDEALEEYEITADDINNRKNADIFKLITTRYMQSAYPVFFEKKENSVKE